MSGETELFLVLAARAAHVREMIEPNLTAGKVVLCDRYSDATVAYQGYGRGLPIAEILAADRLASGGRRPDWTVLLDLPAEAGLTRVQARNSGSVLHKREGRIDDESIAFHERVRSGYLELARAEPERFTRVDAVQNAEVIAAQIEREAIERGLIEAIK